MRSGGGRMKMRGEAWRETKLGERQVTKRWLLFLYDNFFGDIFLTTKLENE